MLNYIFELFTNIFELFTNIYTNIKIMLYIYFTPLPSLIFENANSTGNMAFAGIGLGLMHYKKIFWISTGGIFILTYFKTIDSHFYFILSQFGKLIFSFMLVVSLKETNNLIRYLKK